MSQSSKKGMIAYDFNVSGDGSPNANPYRSQDKKEKHIIEGPSEGKIA